VNRGEADVGGDAFAAWLDSPAGAAVTATERKLMRVAWDAATERAAGVAEGCTRADLGPDVDSDDIQGATCDLIASGIRGGA